MEIKLNLPHVDENEWEDYVLTEEDSKKSPLLRNVKSSLDKTKFNVKINKDKTQLHIYNSFGDEAIFDLKNEKIISFSLGF